MDLSRSRKGTAIHGERIAMYFALPLMEPLRLVCDENSSIRELSADKDGRFPLYYCFFGLICQLFVGAMISRSERTQNERAVSPAVLAFAAG